MPPIPFDEIDPEELCAKCGTRKRRTMGKRGRHLLCRSCQADANPQKYADELRRSAERRREKQSTVKVSVSCDQCKMRIPDVRMVVTARLPSGVSKETCYSCAAYLVAEQQASLFNIQVPGLV